MGISPASSPLPQAIACLLLAILLLAPIPTMAEEELGPFFLMGSGRLHMKNRRNGREARIALLNADGTLNDAALNEVDRVFGFPTAAKGEHISPRLLGMVSHFADRVAPGKTIQIESAYRSPAYNDGIRKKGANAARTSAHMDGMALDFWIKGVDGRKLWQIIREQDCCGVGHYGGKAIHLDAGRPRFWEAATSGTKAVEPDYNRHLYLSTDYDRYRPGARLRLSLSGLSTFGFGVKPTAAVEADDTGERSPLTLDLPAAGGSDCILLKDRKATRFLYASLPPTLPPGRYRIGLEFCNRPFAQMPATALSNAIELVGTTPP